MLQRSQACVDPGDCTSTVRECVRQSHAIHTVEGTGSERNCSIVPPYLPPTASNTTKQLHELRAVMKTHNISAYIIPGTDAHLSEYIAPRDARLAWMSGFTGSSGTAVVTLSKAMLWTDSRYWVQAERQMDCNWELERDISISSITDWLIKELSERDQVGFDPFLFSVYTFDVYNNNLAPSKRILTSIPDNLEKLLQSQYSPVLTTKAIKDTTEQKILREAHIRDAVAVMQLLHQLERTVPEGKETELTAAQLVNKYRSLQELSKGPSFETISASGPNAALAHYSDGTTDITRTVHWGSPSTFQKEAYTRVLMGNIEISRTIFPAGTRGKTVYYCVNMEMLGRRALWEVGLNYGHGTGHGVGNYFGVHEWPVGFQSNNIPFQQGMFTSIEPGYYRVNEFGIRIEDVAVIVPAKTAYGNNYLTFNTVSLVPYDRKLIDTSILSPVQLQWLDAYYLDIRSIVGPELQKQGLTDVYNWMMQNTEPFLKTESSAAVPSISLLLLLLSIASV
ncbi:Xaa-Pro aminopeptidase 2 [Bagarius yarrelli]|uniref:Xaa-Pro aminopeptidase 2 n=1 Tax=Bagarius yarrelli TaxID=175774 RepID=A0A556V0G7_BAGYA|nr:Xaa-Pro aminopeptidase 2 [Bagarius yarrelli]